MLKKIVQLIASVVLAISLTACGGGEIAPMALVIGGGEIAHRNATEEPTLFEVLSSTQELEIIGSAPKTGQTICDAPVSQIAARQPEFVVVTFGIEDSTKLSSEEFEDCLTAIYQAAFEAQSILVITEATPVVDGGAWSQVYDATNVGAIEGKKRNWLGKYCQAPEVAADLVNFPDGVHPSESVKKNIAQQWVSCILRA